MKTITVPNSELKHFLKSAASAIKANSNLAELRNLELSIGNGFEARSTNLESWTHSILDYGENDGKGIRFARVDGKSVSTIVKSLPKKGTSEITFGSDSLKIGNCSYPFSPSDSAILPFPGTLKGGQTLTLSVEDFQNIKKKVLPFAATNESSVVMMGVLFSYDHRENELTVVSTDGTRLGRIQITFEDQRNAESFAFVMPKETALFAADNLSGDVCLHYDDKGKLAMLSDGTSDIVSRTIDGQFPKYQAAIPAESKAFFTVDRKGFAAKIKEAISIVSEDDKRVTLQLGKNLCQIHTDSDGALYEGSIECDFDNDEMTIGFNGKFLLGALNSMESECVHFGINSPTTAILIEEGDVKKGLRQMHLLMPCRVLRNNNRSPLRHSTVKAG